MSAKEKIDKHKHESATNENGVGDSGDGAPKTSDETELVVPPDGGWGWVVVIASFICNTLVDGMVYSCGLLLVPMNETFNVSTAQMGFVSSLLSGFYMLAGPFVSALANRYGFRIVAIIGSIFAACCFAASYFANGVIYMYIVYGILGGIGFSMIYIPAVIIVGFYFERWRALATGICMCGSGVGTFVFAPLSTYLLNQFGWRGTLLAHAGIILLCVACAAMFRPLKPTKVKVANGDDEETKRKGAEKLTLLLETQIPADMQNKSSPHTWMGVAPNDSYPTAAEIFRKSHTNLEMRRLSTTGDGKVKSQDMQGNGHSKPKYIMITKGHEENVEEGIGKNENTVPLLNEDSNTGERRNTVGARHPKEHNRSRRGTLTNENQVSRPMYREDIFFGGSLKKIPQYQSKTSIGYHLSVTHLPTVEDVEEETESKCTICPEAIKRTLVTMLDFSLLKSPSFMLLAFSGFFSMMGVFAPVVYVQSRATSGGMGDSALWLVSTFGIANTLGRILCGVLSSLESVDALLINNIALTLGGIATVMSGISYSAAYQFSYCIVFGLSIACFASLRSIIVVELLGLEKLTNAYGLLMMFQGIAAIIGVPLAGVFLDLTGSYDASFYIAGGVYLFSAFLCYPLRMVLKWEKNRTKTDDKVKSDVM